MFNLPVTKIKSRPLRSAFKTKELNLLDKWLSYHLNEVAFSLGNYLTKRH